jgi:hypothetical protein
MVESSSNLVTLAKKNGFFSLLFSSRTNLAGKKRFRWKHLFFGFDYGDQIG